MKCWKVNSVWITQKCFFLRDEFIYFNGMKMNLVNYFTVLSFWFFFVKKKEQLPMNIFWWTRIIRSPVLMNISITSGYDNIWRKFKELGTKEKVQRVWEIFENWKKISLHCVHRNDNLKVRTVILTKVRIWEQIFRC